MASLVCPADGSPGVPLPGRGGAATHQRTGKDRSPAPRHRPLLPASDASPAIAQGYENARTDWNRTLRVGGGRFRPCGARPARGHGQGLRQCCCGPDRFSRVCRVVRDPVERNRAPLHCGTGRPALNGPAPLTCVTEGFRKVLLYVRPGQADGGPIEIRDAIEPVRSGVSAAAMRTARTIQSCPNP